MCTIDKRMLVIAAFAAMSIFDPAFAQTDSPLVASVRKAGEVKVAAYSQPPFSVISPKGEAEGVLLEVEAEILKQLGLPGIKPVLTAFSAMIPALQANQVDFVAGLTPTEERCKAPVVFSAPIYVNRLAMFVRSGNPKHVTSLAQIAQSPDIKVALIDGGAQSTYALKNGVKPEQVVRVPDVQAGVATVVNGRADAYIETDTAVNKPEERGLQAVTDPTTPLAGASATFRKEDVRLRDAFNEKRIAVVKSGFIQKIYDKYGLSGGEAQAQTLAKVTKASDISPSCE